jgi:hypothetical protein
VRLVGFITLVAITQVPLDRLAGKDIELTVEITIHQACEVLAVHLISTN